MCRHFPSHGDEAVTDTHPSMRLVMLTSDSNCHDKEYLTKRLTICMTKLRMNKSMFDERLSLLMRRSQFDVQCGSLFRELIHASTR